MAGGAEHRSDFFLSRRGSVAAIAREVADVLTEKGYNVVVQDYDIRLGASFIEAMHEAIKNARDLIVLFTGDYEESAYTRKEFTSFEAERAQSPEQRRIVILRCEDAPLRGLLAGNVYQDLVGIEEPEERRRRIIAAAEGHSQTAPPPPRPFVGVPPRIAGFAGRSDEFDRLDAILVQEKPAAVTQAVGRAAVQGMGGVGKTSLAVEYAYRFRNLYAGVCWCPAETRAGLMTSLAALAVKLQAVAADDTNVENAAKAALHRLAEQRATWLLIYDNVTAPEEIVDLLPAEGARVLITSRFSDWGGWAEEVALDVLSMEEAVVFLQSRSGRSDEVGARALAEALGRLPLGLDHAAATCRRTQMRFTDYAAKASRFIAAAPRGTAYPRSVAATFDLAIAVAEAQCPAAEALMAFFAQCAPERIPIALVEGAVDDEAERLEALAALTEVSLVKHDPFEDDTPAVIVHRLVQAVARARSKTTDMARDPSARMIARLMAIYPRDGYHNPRSWPLCAQLTPHLLVARETPPEGGSMGANWADLLNRAGRYSHGRASYAQAESLFRTALAVREQALGTSHPDTAESLNNLGHLLWYQGDLAGARPLVRRALAIREEALGPEHPDTAESLNSLGRLSEERGDLTVARPLLERALAVREQVFGSEHRSTAESLNNLARLLRHQGNLVEARPLVERALAIREKVLGPEHRDTAASLRNLARLLEEQGDVAGAHPLVERALAIRERVLGTEHPDTNRDRRHLARLLLAAGEASKALALGEIALAAHEKVLGRSHIFTTDSAHLTAEALEALGRADEQAALRVRFGIEREGI